MDNIISVNKIFSVNKNLLLFLFIIFVVGIISLYSAATGNFSPWASKQIWNFCIFFPMMLLVALVNINIWYKFAYVIYAASLGLVLFIEIYGHTAMGATRWIKLFGFNIQSSEIMKLSLIIGLARYFFNKDLEQIQQNKYLIVPLIMILVPTALVLRQPDLGTAFILLVIGAGIMFTAGVQWQKFAICFAIAVVAFPFAWRYGLHDYQKKRLEVFINPEKDPLGSGYNIMQSKIAIGSGGFFGKGYLKGTQSQLAFLPEKQTDFIFTMITEEIGFIGGTTIIIIYIIMLGFMTMIAFNSEYTFGRIIAVGVNFIFFFHVFINIGMVIGILPVVGVPLPFMSYGGTIMATSLMSFGFILNADIYKNTEIKKVS